MTLLQNQRKGDGVAGGLPIHLVLQVLRIEGPGAAVQPTRHMRATARMQADKRATGLLVCMGISSMTAAPMIGESPDKGKSQPAEGRLGFGHETRL